MSDKSISPNDDENLIGNDVGEANINTNDIKKEPRKIYIEVTYRLRGEEIQRMLSETALYSQRLV